MADKITLGEPDSVPTWARKENGSDSCHSLDRQVRRAFMLGYNCGVSDCIGWRDTAIKGPTPDASQAWEKAITLHSSNTEVSGGTGR